MRHAAAGCVVLAAVLTLVGWTIGLVVLVAGRVVADWQIASALLAAALVLAIVNRIRRGDRLDWRVRVVAVLAVFGTLFSAVGDLGARYSVLRPTSADGCQVVARETSFLFAGSGEVFLAGSLGFGTRVGSYRSDDGYRPFSENSYSLTWRTADTGTLTISGEQGNPVWPDVDTLDC